jgi:putative ATPase
VNRRGFRSLTVAAPHRPTRHFHVAHPSTRAGPPAGAIIQTVSLFDPSPVARAPEPERPLAERMRPESLDEYVGQEHILGPGKPLRQQIERDQVSSMILWGPPGSGKTTLARLIAGASRADFVPFSAVLSGIKEVKAVMADAERRRRLGRRTVLFIDEIHRFNKAQQDAFLPYVERGDITLIGATTENPSFEVISALLSRTKVYQLRGLTPEEIVGLLQRALDDPTRGLGARRLAIAPELLEQIAIHSNGDARSAYNLLELVAAAAGPVTAQTVEDALQRKVLLYDKAGEEHFNLISALHKSVRSSDPDAALYWLARMIEGGEDRLYIARRLVRMAIEDIGMADPRAMEQSIAAMQTVHFLGIPEGDQALAQAAIYLAMAPKSDAAYRALGAAAEAARTRVAEPVPLALRNAPTPSMKEWGYGKGYQHAHEFDDAMSPMECLPESLAGTRFYLPKDRGVEARLRERLEEIRRARGKTTSSPSP